tara:strand:- start:275 stop:961 length:687 start_codon:yes stop_codon:yes gene_type:complete
MEKSGQESFLSLLINIIIPSVILIGSKKFDSIDPIFSLIGALMFPLSYVVFELITEKKWSFIPLLGFCSILLTGSIAVFKLPPKLIAVKESLVPFIIGLVVLSSIKTKNPGMIFITKSLFDYDKIEKKVSERGESKKLRECIIKSTILLSCSFLVSTVLNFLLAVIIVKSPSGSVEFNEEIGLMTALSYPVIAVPSVLIMFVSMWYFVKEVKKLTHYSFEEMIHKKLK